MIPCKIHKIGAKLKHKIGKKTKDIVSLASCHGFKYLPTSFNLSQTETEKNKEREIRERNGRNSY